MTKPDFLSAVESGYLTTPQQAAELLAKIIDHAPPKPAKQYPPPLCGPVQRPKPCPFCGGEPEKLRRNLGDHYAYAEEVTYRCTSCGCEMTTMGTVARGEYADNSTVDQRAITAWNRRDGGCAK